MWIWISIAIIGVAFAVMAVARGTRFRRRGFALIGIALLMVLGIEALIRADVISVGLGSELMGIATILIVAWAIWRLPRLGRDGPRGE